MDIFFVSFPVAEGTKVCVAESALIGPGLLVFFITVGVAFGSFAGADAKGGFAAALEGTIGDSGDNRRC